MMNEYSNLPSDMLRPTKRLQEHAKSLGEVIIEQGNGSDYTLFHLQEVEFISGFHGFNFWMLEALLKRYIDCWMPEFMTEEGRYRPKYRREQDNTQVLVSTKRVPRKMCYDNQSINILWLSPNEFVTPLSFPCDDSYSVEFSFNRRSTISRKWSSLEIYAYHIDNVSFHDDKSFPTVTLQFLHQIVPPVSDKITKILFNLSEDQSCLPPSVVSSMLELVPTNLSNQSARGKDDYLRVLFEGYLSEEHVEVFARYPFHTSVRFGFKKFNGLTAERYNQLLLQFHHLRHVEVPLDLELVDCDDTLFTANSGFESLTARVLFQLPLNVIEGISANSNIKHLIVHHRRNISPNNTLVNVLAMLRRKIKTLTKLTVQCQVFSFEECSGKTRSQLNECFHDWCDFLCSGDNKKLTQRWELSSFRFEFEDGRERPFIKIGGWYPIKTKWEVLVVPSLTLNWYRQMQQRQLVSSAKPVQEIRTMALAIRAINHGIIYRKTTNVFPSSLSSSNSTVIYAMLQQNIYPLIKGQTCAKRKHAAL
jgi:hypothetical protein